MSFALLGVNIDHVATLRQARGTHYPDPIAAAAVAEAAGADSITVHLREDRRHIQDSDVVQLREHIRTKLNLEMALTDEMMAIAEQIAPQDCCLVPERREELTTEGGLDVVGHLQRVQEGCMRLREAGIRVSLFIDPEPPQIEAAAEAGVSAIELHTGRYAEAQPKSVAGELDTLANAVGLGRALGLQVNAGHGLNYTNTAPISALPEIVELNIGHAIVARAVFVGLGAAVSEMKALMTESRL